MGKFVTTYWKTILCSICILILSIAPFSSRGMKPIPNLDKVIHTIMYLVFTLILVYDFRKNHSTMQIRTLAIVILLPILYGGIMEVFQGIFTTNRYADIFDFLANSVGVFIGLIISYTVYYFRR